MLQEPSPNASNQPENLVPPPPPPPKSQPPLPPHFSVPQPASPPPKDNKTRNYILATIVSVLVVCGGLMSWSRSYQAEQEQRDRDAASLFENAIDPLEFEAQMLSVTTSDYVIGSFSEAAQTLEIEPVDEWPTFTHDDFTVRLPRSMNQLTYEELTALAEQGGLDTSELDGVFAAMDERSTTTGLLILIQRIPTTSQMSPALYIVGVGAEVSANGLVIRDKAAYAANGRDIGRLIYEGRPTDTPFSVVQYAYVPHKKNVLLITISCTSDSLATWLPIFEAIAHNFNVD